MLLRRELTAACSYSVLVIRRVHSLYSVFAEEVPLEGTLKRPFTA